jgi:hypothetical protein
MHSASSRRSSASRRSCSSWKAFPVPRSPRSSRSRPVPYVGISIRRGRRCAPRWRSTRGRNDATAHRRPHAGSGAPWRCSPRLRIRCGGWRSSPAVTALPRNVDCPASTPFLRRCIRYTTQASLLSIADRPGRTAPRPHQRAATGLFMGLWDLIWRGRRDIRGASDRVEHARRARRPPRRSRETDD